MKISIGRIVHFKDQYGECTAAICNSVHSVTGNPNLTVFSTFAGSTHYWPNVSEGTENRTWHWPERVGD